MDRIEYIRAYEKSYHEAFYDTNQLFAQDSWLHKPVKTVMELLEYFSKSSHIKVLDLGCGVGRNSIPIARQIQDQDGRVICVDLLQTAIEHLKKYSVMYGVEALLEDVVADISDYVIAPETFDYIVAVSSLEHVHSETAMDKLLLDMSLGTRSGGIVCLIVNSSVEEIDVETNQVLEPMIEVNLATDHLLRKLKDIYRGWEELHVLVKPLTFEITRNGKPVLLKTNAITFAVRKLHNRQSG